MMNPTQLKKLSAAAVNAAYQYRQALEAAAEESFFFHTAAARRIYREANKRRARAVRLIHKLERALGLEESDFSPGASQFRLERPIFESIYRELEEKHYLDQTTEDDLVLTPLDVSSPSTGYRVGDMHPDD